MDTFTNFDTYKLECLYPSHYYNKDMKSLKSLNKLLNTFFNKKL